MTHLDRQLLVPMSEWLHPKTGGTYIVLGIATCSSNGPDENKVESVIYQSKKHQALYYRLLSEFLDGRFAPLQHDGTPIVFGPQPLKSNQ